MDPLKIGLYKNGSNCGRFIRVTLKQYCSGGLNDGTPGTSYCSGGTFIADDATDAYQDFMIMHSC